MSYFYGPVPSRRLGVSLGVDLVPPKVCTFDCLYCQLKSPSRKTLRRRFYVDMNKFRRQLKEKLKATASLDYITLSGSGEPTLHKDLDTITREIKKISNYSYPVCIITNSSLLYRKDLRKELRAFDLIIPSLDAPNSQLFSKINRPHRGISFTGVLDGIVKLKKEFKGKIWLEIMLIKGLNDSPACAESFKRIIKLVRPDKVQINLAVRPCRLKSPLPSRKTINKFKKIISGEAEVVSYYKGGSLRRRKFRFPDRAVLDFLRRRPATLEDLSGSLGISTASVRAALKVLSKKGLVKEINLKSKRYLVFDDQRKYK